MKSIKTDVLIIGGGPAGGSLACALGQSEMFQNGNRIMIHNGQKTKPMSAYRQQGRLPDGEIVTLNPSSLRLLESIGVLDMIESKYLNSFDDMIVNE